MQDLGYPSFHSPDVLTENMPLRPMWLCMHSHPCMYSRSYLQNTPSNYCLAYQAGSRSAHSIWPLSWQQPNGCRGGVMRGSVACLVKWGCQSFSRWHEFKECGWTMDGESEEAKLKEKGRGGRMRGEEKKRERRKRDGSEGGEWRLESTWSVIQERKRRRAGRSCNNTVWQSEGELLGSQHGNAVYTQTHTYTLNVRLCAL